MGFFFGQSGKMGDFQSNSGKTNKPASSVGDHVYSSVIIPGQIPLLKKPDKKKVGNPRHSRSPEKGFNPDVDRSSGHWRMGCFSFYKESWPEPQPVLVLS